MKLTSFSRNFWATVVACNVAKPKVLRDYDIVQCNKRGMTCGQIAIKFDITCRQVMRILEKYN